MDTNKLSRDRMIHSQLTRSRGRTGRNQNANARLTIEELDELRAAAKAEGKALGEWNRDVLLREARRGCDDHAVFTELIALRMLVNNVLRALALGRTMSEKEYAQVLTEIRTNKHSAANDVLNQYQKQNGGQ
jgi:hypothetical protein